jgi:hypothetical protein
MRNAWGTYGPVPGWTDEQLAEVYCFPYLDMQDEIDQIELGIRPWLYLEDQLINFSADHGS